MKQFSKLTLLTLGMSFALTAMAQQNMYEVPSQVNTLVLKGATSIEVVPDTHTRLETRGKKVEVSDSVMTIDYDLAKMVLHLRPADICYFEVKEKAELTFKGNFAWPNTLSVQASVAAIVKLGDKNNTLSAPAINLEACDFARIKSEGKLQMETYQYKSKDLASINLNISQLVNINGNATGGSTLDDELSSIYIQQMINIEGDTASYEGHSDVDIDGLYTVTNGLMRAAVNDKKWRSSIDFAFGFHNWGTQWYNGFAGVGGASEIKTSMNNLQLSFNYPLIKMRYAALYAGVGLEWDKYKFTTGNVALNTTGGEPYRFGIPDGLDEAFNHTQLLTRYVEVPISLHIRLGDSRWKLELAAIPGIHWGGSHTGFRRQLNTDDMIVKDKDQSINSYINPYKLDARVVVRYRGWGVYLQLPTIPALRSSCENLYPIKFGIIL